MSADFLVNAIDRHALSGSEARVLSAVMRLDAPTRLEIAATVRLCERQVRRLLDRLTERKLVSAAPYRDGDGRPPLRYQVRAKSLDTNVQKPMTDMSRNHGHKCPETTKKPPPLININNPLGVLTSTVGSSSEKPETGGKGVRGETDLLGDAVEPKARKRATTTNPKIISTEATLPTEPTRAMAEIAAKAGLRNGTLGFEFAKWRLYHLEKATPIASPDRSFLNWVTKWARDEAAHDRREEGRGPPPGGIRPLAYQ